MIGLLNCPIKKLSDDNLASELVENRSFANQSQSRKLLFMGGFRGGAEGTAALLFISCIFKTFLYDPNPSNRPYNRSIKCSLILSSETLTLLNFASRIRPQSCMLHLLKSEFSFGGGGRVERTRTPLSELSGFAPIIFVIGNGNRTE